MWVTELKRGDAVRVTPEAGQPYTLEPDWDDTPRGWTLKRGASRTRLTLGAKRATQLPGGVLAYRRGGGAYLTRLALDGPISARFVRVTEEDYMGPI